MSAESRISFSQRGYIQNTACRVLPWHDSYNLDKDLDLTKFRYLPHTVNCVTIEIHVTKFTFTVVQSLYIAILVTKQYNMTLWVDFTLIGWDPKVSLLLDGIAGRDFEGNLTFSI